MRYIFALHKLFKNRHLVKQFISDKELNISSLVDISVDYLHKRQVSVLILDFDGVMAEHGANTPKLEVVHWLFNIISQMPALKIFILSNKPTQSRISYFSNNFSAIEFISSPRKKPYPDGIEAILAKTKLNSLQHLMVDDRLATGVLAAVLCNVQAVWISKPYNNLRENFLVEAFFCLLRRLDKMLILLASKF